MLLAVAVQVGVVLEGGLGRGAVLLLGGVRQLLRVLLLLTCRQVETLTGGLLVLVHDGRKEAFLWVFGVDERGQKVWFWKKKTSILVLL